MPPDAAEAIADWQPDLASDEHAPTIRLLAADYQPRDPKDVHTGLGLVRAPAVQRGREWLGLTAHRRPRLRCETPDLHRFASKS